MNLRTCAIAAAFALALSGGAAQAAVCGGAPPEGATSFRGPVLEVLDGERICVALGPDPASWAPVRLADALQTVSTAAPSRGALMAASFGQDVTCRILGRDAQGVVATCESARGSIGAIAHKARLIKAGQAWR